MSAYKDIIQDGSLNLANKTAVTVYISGDEKVTIDKRPELSKKPNYFMIGNGTMNKHRIYGIDLLTEIVNSSKAGQYLILAIKDGITYMNEYNPVVKVVGTTKYEQNMIIAGYKELVERDLVRRVKKAHYMINPNALVPIDYIGALKVWDTLVTPEKKKEKEPKLS